jgi:long-chain acyl-CoA synthetase
VAEGANKFSRGVAFQIKRAGGYRQYSYRDVYELVSNLAAHLRSQHIDHGDRVAILSENRPEWAIAYLAIASLGAINVPLDAKLAREEVVKLLENSGAKLILTSASLAKEHKFSLRQILMEEIEKLKSADLPAAQVGPADLAAIIYTSGTTGAPKGVMLTHENIMSNVTATVKLFNIGPKDNFLSVLPLHHTFEATAGFLGPFYLGACVTYAESLKSHLLLANMRETRVTIMCGVPLLYKLFYEGILREVEEKGIILRAFFYLLMGLAKIFKPEPLRRLLFWSLHRKLGRGLRFWVSGGAAIDPEIIRGFATFGITILQGYGLTESSPILACCTLRHNRVGSVGRPLSNVKIKLTAEGEITAFGPNIMQGYYKRPDLTAEVLKNGWLYTGDVGKIDRDGYVYITGRSKDLIVTGSGVNVYPEEIEFFVNRIPGVAESCVLGVKAKEGLRRGMEEVWAIIVPDYDYFKKRKLDQQRMEHYLITEIHKLNQKLTEYKRIANVKIRSIELPKTTTRKVRRFQVKAEMGLK